MAGSSQNQIPANGLHYFTGLGMAERREMQEQANKSCFVSACSGARNGREKRKTGTGQQILLYLSLRRGQVWPGSRIIKSRPLIYTTLPFQEWLRKEKSEIRPTSLSISRLVPRPVMAGRREKQEQANKSCFVPVCPEAWNGREKRSARTGQQILPPNRQVCCINCLAEGQFLFLLVWAYKSLEYALLSWYSYKESKLHFVFHFLQRSLHLVEVSTQKSLLNQIPGRDENSCPCLKTQPFTGGTIWQKTTENTGTDYLISYLVLNKTRHGH